MSNFIRRHIGSSIKQIEHIYNELSITPDKLINKTLDIVKLLLDHDADPNYILKEHNDTALHVAIAWKENIDIVEILLNYGADPNIRDGDGNTGLIWASYYGHTKIVELLLV